MMILILLMAAAVSCSRFNPVLQEPSGGMPEGMEFCNQGRIKKLCHKGVFQPTTVKGPIALAFCPGTLKKLCPIKPVALRFSSGPVTSIPVGWKVCRDNLGLCPVSRYSTRRRPTMSRPSFPGIERNSFPLDSRVGRPSKRPIYFPSAFPTTHNNGMVPCKYRAGLCFPESVTSIEAKPGIYNKGMVPCKDRMGMCFPESVTSIEAKPGTFNKGMVPCKDRMGMCFPESVTSIEAKPGIYNKGMVPCKDRMGMCFPESNTGFVESRPMTRNKGMVPCKDRMGMCFPEN